MKTICKWISEYMGVLVWLSAVAAMVWPEVFSLISPKVISPLLGVIMFGMGLTLKVEDFRVVFSRPKDVIIGCVAQFTVMPLLAWTLARVFQLDEALTVGVVLVGCCPGGTASNVITYLAKGDLALSVGMTGVSTLLAPVVTPLLVWLLAGKTVDVDVAGMLLSILWVVILPIVAGLVVKRLWPRQTSAVTAYLPAVSTLAICAIVLIVIAANAGKLMSGGLMIVLVVMLHNVCGLSIGYGIGRFIGIGEALERNRNLFSGLDAAFFNTTEDFIHQYDIDRFNDETILLKGARRFHFEDIARLLQRKSHQTVMEVNLDNLVSNLNYYRSLIRPRTRLMAMVKAASYGAGKAEVAGILQYNHVDYLTVAYSDEGVDLRRNGITLPIMVMNPEEESFADIIRYRLEPDIYSFRILDLFSDAVRSFGKQEESVPVHIELDTGMHRLGFAQTDLDELAQRLNNPDCPLAVRSIFSHLACADDPAADDFTRLQLERFGLWANTLRNSLRKSDILLHILNSSGIERFPEAQYDMVRLGIGLYGLSPQPAVQSRLKPVSTLKTRISQLKDIPQGDSVGYNRAWVAQRPSRIAIASIGYADGLNRHLGNGNAQVLVNGRLVPVIGHICMDMCFLDVTGVDCAEDDEVTIFGDATLLQQIARSAGTIPYEILTSVSPRVKRIYYQE